MNPIKIVQQINFRISRIKMIVVLTIVFVTVIAIPVSANSLMTSISSPIFTRQQPISFTEKHNNALIAPPGCQPLVFIENLGQFDPDIQFQASSGQTTIFLTKEAVWISTIESFHQSGSKFEYVPFQSNTERRTSRQANLKLSFVGANQSPQVEPFSERETNISFFSGKDSSNWRTSVPAWEGVRYRDLYPGIDLELTTQNGQLSLRLEGQDISSLQNIQMKVDGADNLVVDGNRLQASTQLGDISLPLLSLADTLVDFHPSITSISGAYYISTPFVSNYQSITNNTAISTTTLLTSTYLGNSGDDQAYAITLDGDQNIYITGRTTSVNFPTSPGAYDISYNGNPFDVFVTKLSADGSTIIYSTFIGGNDEDVGHGIAVDSLGNTYITGRSFSTDFPTTTGALDTTLNGGRDAFVLKLNSSGSDLIYSTYLGGNNWDYGLSLAIDQNYNAYIGGFTHGSFPVTTGAAQTTFGGAGDAFVTKLNDDGSQVIFSTYTGGYSWDQATGITVDRTGAVFITGDTHSTDFPTTPGAWDRVCDYCDWISANGYVTKLSPDGSSFIFSTFVGSNGSDTRLEGLISIVVDETGNAYITGRTSADDYPTTNNALQPNYGGGDLDAVITKLSADGSDLIYSTYFGGNQADSGYDLAIDNHRNIYITGFTNSSNLQTINPLQATNAGGFDAFVAKINPFGSALLFSSYLGGSGDENSDAYPHDRANIALGNHGNVYLTGFTASADFPTTEGSYNRSYNGGEFDIFVSVIGIPTNDNELHEIYLPYIQSAQPSIKIEQGTTLLSPRTMHSSTRLKDGKILIAAGSKGNDQHLASAAIFDPTTEQIHWATPMHTARHDHTATLLSDGRVLVIGGYGLPNGWIDNAEIYDPVTDTWTVVPPHYSHGVNHTATLMKDGRVLVVGGCYGSSLCSNKVEIFDPITNTWSAAQSLPMDRSAHTALLLENGKILVAGGGSIYDTSDDAQALTYDSEENSWDDAGLLNQPRLFAQSILLMNGKVLITGGGYNDSPYSLGILSSSEIYDPILNTWSPIASMSEPRYGFEIIHLTNGRVLVVGGARDWDNVWTDQSFVKKIEIYDSISDQWTVVGEFLYGIAHPAASTLQNGQIWVTGGRSGLLDDTFHAETWLLTDH